MSIFDIPLRETIPQPVIGELIGGLEGKCEVLQATLIAQRSHYAEKLGALENAVLNIASAGGSSFVFFSTWMAHGEKHSCIEEIRQAHSYKTLTTAD